MCVFKHVDYAEILLSLKPNITFVALIFNVTPISDEPPSI